jgi:glycosyltransferase involved in cell wall biosynthesis
MGRPRPAPSSPILPDAPLRVVLVDSHDRIERGGAVQCAALARGLARAGHAVTCVFDAARAGVPCGAGFDELAAAGVELVGLPLASPASALRLRRLVARRAAQVIHTHKNRALRLVAAAFLTRPPAPWVANRGTVYPLRPGSLVGWLHRARVDRVLAVSRAVAEAVVASGVPAERVEVVYGSFDPRRFGGGADGSALRAAWGAGAGTSLVGVVGSLATPKKGHGVFLDAAARLAEARPSLRFVLVGDGDPTAFRERARELGLGERIVFAGFVREVEQALAALDVVVCASLRGEGLTGALREALALARPVVSTDVAGNPEIVRHGETGLLVPPGDAAALARAVGELLDDPARARALAERGRARVSELCSEERRVARVVEIYRALVRERAAAS